MLSSTHTCSVPCASGTLTQHIPKVPFLLQLRKQEHQGLNRDPKLLTSGSHGTKIKRKKKSNPAPELTLVTSLWLCLAAPTTAQWTQL